MDKISVIGAGSWGTALSILLAQKGFDVWIWSCFEEEINNLNRVREHKNLPGISLPPNIICSADIDKVMKDSELTIIVVPSQAVRETAQIIKNNVQKDGIVVCCSKGLEEETGLRLSQVIKEVIPQSKLCVLSGPSHAEEVAAGIPTAVVASSESLETACYVQDIFMTPQFRVYTNEDVVGVEIGGAIKNVIALCAGISDGLGFGDNTKAALMTRGITEIARLGVAIGAKVGTFTGLTGIGDLIVTCTSRHSRNRKAGMLIGQGKTRQEALLEVGMVVEGISSTKAAFNLSRKYNVEMPIIEEAYNVLFKNKDCWKAVTDLMTRDKKSEVENSFY